MKNSMDIYNLTKVLVQNYKNLRKETPSTHRFLAKAKNLFFVSKEFHLSESDIEFLNREMDFLEKAYNGIFEKDHCFSNLTETELEDIKKNLEFFTMKYENYYEYLNFARLVLAGFIALFLFGFIKNILKDIVGISILVVVIGIFIYAAIPQIIANTQAKREILKEIEILIDKRIIQLKRDIS